MKKNYAEYLKKVLDENDVVILKFIKNYGSDKARDLYDSFFINYVCIGFDFSDFLHKLHQYTNYGLLKKMGVTYTGDDDAYFCISSDGLEFLKNLGIFE